MSLSTALLTLYVIFLFQPAVSHITLPVAVSPATNFRNGSHAQRHDYDIIVRFDHTFCNLHSNSVVVTRQFLSHLFTRSVKPLFAETSAIISPISITGSCTPPDDPYTRPDAAIAACPVDAANCSRPAAILNSFRTAFQTRDPLATRHGRRLARSVVFLFTGYGSGDSAIGATFLGAACSQQYSFAWVQVPHRSVVAHEIAHTLGAPHNVDGLMRPRHHPHDVPYLANESIADINTFISKASTRWCLAHRNHLDRIHTRQMLGITMPLPPAGWQLNGTDITFANLTYPSIPLGSNETSTGFEANLLMLYVGGSARHDRLTYLVAYDVAISTRDEFTVSRWSNAMDIPLSRITQRRFPAGGGIAHARLGPPSRRTAGELVVVYATEANRLQFRVGSVTNDGSGRVRRWRPERVVPLVLPGTVLCVGAALGDISGSGRPDDLVIVYVTDPGIAYYIVARGLNSRGIVRGGWSPAREIPDAVRSMAAGDISVTLLDTTSSGMLDLFINVKDQVVDVWRNFILIGRDLDASGTVSGTWSSRIPGPLVLARTGGVAAGWIPGGEESEQPGTVFLQGGDRIVQRDGMHGFLDTGFEWRRAAQDEASGVMYQHGVQQLTQRCEICYNETGAAVCIEKMKACETRISALTVAEEDISFSNFGVGRGLGTTVREDIIHYDSINCTGFHSLYVAPEEETCMQSVGEEDIVVAGAEQAVLNILWETDPNATLSSEIERADWRVTTTPNGAQGPSHTPRSARITIRTSKSLNAAIVREAFRRLSQRMGFTAAFGVVRDSDVRTLSGRRYLVILHFAPRFKDSYVLNDVSNA